jgi:hypothetical protein
MSSKKCSTISDISSKKIRKKIKEIKKDMNDNIVTYNRSISLNDNYNKWTWEYIKVCIVVVVFIFFILLFYKLQLFIVVYLLFTILICLLLVMFSNLHRHDSTNFDEINQGTYQMMSNESVTKYNTAVLEKSVKEPVPYCIGSKCCDTGTVWNDVESKCKVDVTACPSNSLS